MNYLLLININAHAFKNSFKFIIYHCILLFFIHWIDKHRIVTGSAKGNQDPSTNYTKNEWMYKRTQFFNSNEKK